MRWDRTLASALRCWRLTAEIWYSVVKQVTITLLAELLVLHIMLVGYLPYLGEDVMVGYAAIFETISAFVYEIGARAL